MTSDRQDTTISWTPLGRAKHVDFVERALSAIASTDSQERGLMRAFAISHGIVQPTDLERTRAWVGPFIASERFVLVRCSRDQVARARVCARDDDAAYLAMHDADAAGDEVTILQPEGTSSLPLPRLTPFGAKGYWPAGADWRTILDR